jgi:hypothetical protein
VPNHRKLVLLRFIKFRIFISSSQLIQEPSLLHGFEDEVIIEKSRRANEPVLPDLLQSNLQAGNAASKSALTPRVYFENKSNQIFLLSNNVISLFF